MEEQIDTQKTEEQKNFRNNTSIRDRKIFITLHGIVNFII